jgi:hypothetical protein
MGATTQVAQHGDHQQQQQHWHQRSATTATAPAAVAGSTLQQQQRQLMSMLAAPRPPVASVPDSPPVPLSPPVADGSGDTTCGPAACTATSVARSGHSNGHVATRTVSVSRDVTAAPAAKAAPAGLRRSASQLAAGEAAPPQRPATAQRQQQQLEAHPVQWQLRRHAQHQQQPQVQHQQQQQHTQQHRQQQQQAQQQPPVQQQWRVVTQVSLSPAGTPSPPLLQQPTHHHSSSSSSSEAAHAVDTLPSRRPLLTQQFTSGGSTSTSTSSSAYADLAKLLPVVTPAQLGARLLVVPGDGCVLQHTAELCFDGAVPAAAKKRRRHSHDGDVAEETPVSDSTHDMHL